MPNIIVENINYSIDSVLLPVLSEEQNDKLQVKEMTRRAIKTSSYIMMPLMAGLAACAEPLVRLLLTEKWLPCVPFLQVFCIVYAFFPLHTANLNAIKAMGRSDVFLKLEVWKKCLETAILLVTMRYGVMAMALGQLFSGIASLVINAWPNRRLLNYSYMQQVHDMLPSMLLSVFMGFCVILVTRLALSDILTLIIQVPLGVIIYAGLSMLFKIESFNYLLSTLKQMLSRGKKAA